MSTEIREWIEEIWEYCQEHWIVAAAAGAVLLILLVSAGLTLSAKREDRDGPDDEDVQPEAEDSEDADPDMDAELDMAPDTDAVPAQEPVPDSVPESVPGVMETIIKQVEEAGGISGQKVEAIELKIEKAQLTIRYAGGGQVQKDLAPVLGTEPAEEAEEKKETEPSENPKKSEAAPKKFGSENKDTTRSGRVYTEEELLKQIMD